MTPETTMSLSLIFALIAMIGTILGIVNTVRTNNEKETDKRLDIEKQFVGINVKLDNMNASIASLIKKNDSNMREIQEINKNLVLENERIETLYRYKDNHEERIKELEEMIRRNENA